MLGYTGTFEGHPVSVQATGMGTPSASIVVEELIGLGAATSIEGLELQWPAPSTRRERIDKVPVDRYSRIVEGKGLVG